MNTNTDLIVNEMKQYLVDFVEKPHPAFNGLPVCPFSKKARLNNSLLYVVRELDITESLKDVEQWLSSDYHAVIFVDPRKDLDLKAYEQISVDFEQQLPKDLSLFQAHPLSEIKYHGVYTRREPYPNWQVMRKDMLDKAAQQLQKSRWYDAPTCDQGGKQDDQEGKNGDQEGKDRKV